MVTVSEAESIILSQTKDFGTELVSLEQAYGRILAENLYADRDLPPYNRVTMDGIAIKYSSFFGGVKNFTIHGTQAAGDNPLNVSGEHTCIEIMTGAAIPEYFDTVIRYEDLELKDGFAKILTQNIRQGQNIHKRGTDNIKGSLLVNANQMVTPAIIGVSASIGKTSLLVKLPPRVAVISTGDELVPIHETPSPYGVRMSNNYTIRAALEKYGIKAELIHIADDLEATKVCINQCLNSYDVLILSGGISMGKFDYLPTALSQLGVQCLFHKVQQRPGKPFWFGKDSNGPLVFALPGNPVSTFLCFHRYFILWLEASLGLPQPQSYAILSKPYNFKPPLTCFLQVKVAVNNRGQLIATPISGNGSGDFVNLVDANAFLELPAEAETFLEGNVFRAWFF